MCGIQSVMKTAQASLHAIESQERKTKAVWPCEATALELTECHLILFITAKHRDKWRFKAREVRLPCGMGEAGAYEGVTRIVGGCLGRGPPTVNCLFPVITWRGRKTTKSLRIIWRNDSMLDMENR